MAQDGHDNNNPNQGNAAAAADPAGIVYGALHLLEGIEVVVEQDAQLGKVYLSPGCKIKLVPGIQFNANQYTHPEGHHLELSGDGLTLFCVPDAPGE